MHVRLIINSHACVWQDWTASADLGPTPRPAKAWGFGSGSSEVWGRVGLGRRVKVENVDHPRPFAPTFT